MSIIATIKKVFGQSNKSSSSSFFDTSIISLKVLSIFFKSSDNVNVHSPKLVDSNFNPLVFNSSYGE